MKIFKFGGASVKDASAVRNVAAILRKHEQENLVIIISAMGKTTNALEKVASAFYRNNDDFKKLLEQVRRDHLKIMHDLFPDHSHRVYDEVNNVFVQAESTIDEEPGNSFSFIYDQIVSAGELISTKIVSAYLDSTGIKNTWLDVRDCLRTDNTYREGKVDWQATQELMKEKIPALLQSGKKKIITQGFIGGTSENYTTTLGREGSDYTAAIVAYCMDAKDVTIWKDVPGVLNSDPKFFQDAQKLKQISYHDAIELAYYGASVIHPKTIKPLENKNISLFVKSFLHPQDEGTHIFSNAIQKPLIPSFIFKTNQVLISIEAKDFSFIAEENLSAIFNILVKNNVKINLMQNSAISFSICLDYDAFAIPALTENLKQHFKILYNENLQLYTIRHYFPSTIEMLSAGKEILLEQRSRHTVQLVMRDKG